MWVCHSETGQEIQSDMYYFSQIFLLDFLFILHLFLNEYYCASLGYIKF